MFIPSYHKQISFEAPHPASVPARPQRLTQAYKNALQEVGDVLENLPPLRDKTRAPQGVQSSVDAADLRLRQDLLQTAQQEMRQTGRVQTRTLDDWAGKHFLTQEETPAARDYLLLRHTAQAEEQKALAQETHAQAVAEENLICTVGSLAETGKALGAYLAAQLPAYKTRLKQLGMSDAEIEQRVARVRESAVSASVRQALAAGQTQSAADLLSSHQAALSAREQADLSRQLSYASTRKQVETWWAQSAHETDGEIASRHAWTREKLDAVDDPETAHRILGALAEQDTKKKQVQQAREYLSLATVSAEEAHRAFPLAHAISADEKDLARRAVDTLDACAPHADDRTFNQLYLAGSQKEIARAYEKGKVSSREYLALASISHGRAGGQTDPEAPFLCAGIDAWRQKNSLAPQLAENIKKTVLLSGADTDTRLRTLRRIKTLLDM